jgi:hypothetical protein
VLATSQEQIGHKPMGVHARPCLGRREKGSAEGVAPGRARCILVIRPANAVTGANAGDEQKVYERGRNPCLLKGPELIMLVTSIMTSNSRGFHALFFTREYYI